MAYPAWPAVPYKPLMDSWGRPDMYQDPRVTDMEGSNKRMLTRPGDDIYRVSFNVMMTKAQATTFRTWVVTTLGRGTSRFSMDIWNGSAMETVVVQFAAKPAEATKAPMVVFGLDVFVFPGLTP